MTLTRDLTLEEFTEKVRNEIVYYLPASFADAEITVSTMTKLNSSYQALNVRKKGDGLIPALNLDQMFSDFCEGAEFSDIMDRAVDMLASTECNFGFERFDDYEYAKKHLVIRVSNAKKNKEMLENVPWEAREDLAITCHLATVNRRGDIHTAIVTDDMLEGYGISAQQLHKDALKNSMNFGRPILESFASIAMRLGGIVPGEDMMMSIPPGTGSPEFGIGDMYTVSSNMMNGAAALFYPDMMRHIGAILEGDYFILPSSIHEFIIVKDTGDMSARSLKTIVKNVNETEVKPGEWLSDNPYHYCIEDGVFETAEKFEKRKARTEKRSAR